jgi:hypothetical protein
MGKAKMTKSKEEQKEGSDHLVNCTGDGADGTGCVAWVTLWLPKKIPKGFLNRDFLCGYCAAEAVAKLQERTRAESLRETFAEVVSAKGNDGHHHQHNISQLRKELKREERTHDERKNNLIVVGTKPDGNDEDMLKALATELKMKLDAEHLTRVGKVRDDGSQLLKITLPEDQRKELLGRAKLLKESAGFSKVFIQPDYTPEEQKLQYELRMKLKKARDEHPNKKWKISRGRITEVKDEQ